MWKILVIQPGLCERSIKPLPENSISASEILYERTELSAAISDDLTIPLIFTTCSSPLILIFLLPRTRRFPFFKTESMVALIFVLIIPVVFVEPEPLKSLFVPIPRSTDPTSTGFVGSATLMIKNSFSAPYRKEGRFIYKDCSGLNHTLGPIINQIMFFI